jgi:hypothetical protein
MLRLYAKCENCNKECDVEPGKGAPRSPLSDSVWLSVQEYLFNGDTRGDLKHFCSWDCLAPWAAAKQTAEIERQKRWMEERRRIKRLSEERLATSGDLA